MTNYLGYLKRLITFKKYPLFRTIPFRYLLLNILIISILIAAPNVFSLISSVNATSHLTDSSTDLPEFTIQNEMYHGDTQLVEIGSQKVLFTEDLTTEETGDIDDDILIGFLKDGIYVQNVQNSGFSYSLLGGVSNDSELQTFIDNQLSSLYFYIVMYALIYIVLIYTLVFTVLLTGSLLIISVSRLLNKKSDYMNWFKLSSYVTALFYIPFFLLNLFINTPLWYLYVLMLPFYVYYIKKLPALKKK